MTSVRLVAVSAVALLLATAAATRADDIAAKKVVVVDGAKDQILLLSTDAAVQLAGVDDPATNGVVVHVYSATDDACVAIPGGSEWKNKRGAWRYKSKATKNVVQVKAGKLLVNLKSGFTYTLADNGTQGTVNAQVQFGDGTRFCLRCPGNKKDEAKKFLGKSCAAAPCAPETTCTNGTGPTSTTTTVPGGTTTTTLAGTSGFRGLLAQKTTGRFNYQMTLGVPGADAQCNVSFPGSHACTYAELQGAESRGELTGVTETLWAITPGNPDVLQCGATIPWDYATAHTGQFGEQVEVTDGALGELESGAGEGAICASSNSVACCQ
jgi:hypothetical protein